MNLKDFDPIKYHQNSSLRDHLKEIEQHTNEATGIVGSQSEPIDWNSVQTKKYDKINLKDLLQTEFPQKKTDIQGHLAAIRWHTQIALNLIGNSVSSPLSENTEFSLKNNKKNDDENDISNPLGTIATIIFILFFLGFCSQQNNKQESKQKQHSLRRDTPVLVEFVSERLLVQS